LHQLTRQLSDEMNQTFVIVTHNKELAGLSDRCLEMKDGLLNETNGSQLVHATESPAE
jgi:lipoprotein-releasing system ATP-binding protein